jgi:fructokinase
MNALSFGEVLWDVIENEEHIGGAPFNLASHLAQMGADAALISAVGMDERGRNAIGKARHYGLHSEYISERSELPTGVVHVTVDEKGSPSYDIREDSAWDDIRLTEEQERRLSETSWDVLAFGTLAQRTKENRSTLARVVEASGAREFFFDVNLRLGYYDEQILRQSLEYATILKLNEEEVKEVSQLVFGEEVEGEEFCRRMEREWDLHTVIVTRGGNGASVYRAGEYFHVPVIDVTVRDTVGAGDSFAAAFIYGYFVAENLRIAANLAALVSSYVASASGAVPAYDEPVRKAIERVRREAMDEIPEEEGSAAEAEE